MRYSETAYLYKHQFHEQTFVVADTVVEVAAVAQIHRLVEESLVATFGLSGILFGDSCPDVEQRERRRIFTYHEIPEMAAQSVDEKLRSETSPQYRVENEQGLRDITVQQCIGEPEIIVVIENIEVFYRRLVRDISTRGGGDLIENRQCVAHTAIGLTGDDIQGIVVDGKTFLRSDITQVFDYIFNGDTLEIVNLATRQNRRQQFVFLGRCQYENGMMGRFFEGFQKRIERCRRQHMYLIDNKYLVASELRRNAHFIDKAAYFVDRVVRCGIELDDVVRALLIESTA